MDLFRGNIMVDELPPRVNPYDKLPKDKGKDKGKDKLPSEEPRKEKDKLPYDVDESGKVQEDNLEDKLPHKEKSGEEDKLPYGKPHKEKPDKLPYGKPHKEKPDKLPYGKPHKEKPHKQEKLSYGPYDKRRDSRKDIEGKPSRGRTMLKCFFLAFVLGLLILLFFAMVFYISMHPRPPSISIRYANITAFDPYDNFGVSGVNMNIQFSMVANNTHDLTYRFPPGNLNISYWFNETLGYDLCPVVTEGFIVGSKSIREFSASCIQAYQGLPVFVVHALLNDVSAPSVQRVYLRGWLKTRYKTSLFLNNLKKQVGVCQNLTIDTSRYSSEVVKKRCGGHMGCVVERQDVRFDHALACTYY